MEIPPHSGTEAHHIIPYDFADHPLIERAADAGWDINDEYNGLELPAPHAYAGHPMYNDAVGQILNEVYESNPNLTPLQAYYAVTDIIDQLYELIEILGSGPLS
jgi:hypothetical protein